MEKKEAKPKEAGRNAIPLDPEFKALIDQYQEQREAEASRIFNEYVEAGRKKADEARRSFDMQISAALTAYLTTVKDKLPGVYELSRGGNELVHVEEKGV